LVTERKALSVVATSATTFYFVFPNFIQKEIWLWIAVEQTLKDRFEIE